MKLYKLINDLGIWWTIANDPKEAEDKVMKILTAADYGFDQQRKVTEIHIIAESVDDTRFITGKFLIP